jgi:PHD/YefM family antitoxin component YafN of YafNO toxin-antitoxin module
MLNLLRVVVMLDMLKRYPLSEFQQNTDDFMVLLKESQQPIVLTIDGEDALVVEDAIAYQEKLDRLNALLDKE